jgi:predicted RecA/RadA family phage recombinase
MNNHIANGKIFAVTATVLVLSGSLVKVGDLVGVAATDIAVGETGSVSIAGVYEVPKATGFAAAQGSKLYFDATAGKLSGTEAGNTFAGYAYESAATGDTLVRVRLVG